MQSETTSQAISHTDGAVAMESDLVQSLNGQQEFLGPKELWLDVKTPTDGRYRPYLPFSMKEIYFKATIGCLNVTDVNQARQDYELSPAQAT